MLTNLFAVCHVKLFLFQKWFLVSFQGPRNQILKNSHVIFPLQKLFSKMLILNTCCSSYWSPPQFLEESFEEHHLGMATRRKIRKHAHPETRIVHLNDKNASRYCSMLGSSQTGLSGLCEISGE